jgi:hypothetical protein
VTKQPLLNSSPSGAGGIISGLLSSEDLTAFLAISSRNFLLPALISKSIRHSLSFIIIQISNIYGGKLLNDFYFRYLRNIYFSALSAIIKKP